jgi:hypothetical protein
MDKFKFPDEEDEFDIEIEDDTPQEDQGREPMPEDIVKSLEEDELENYSGEVRQRFKQLKKVWHDERRAKEAVTRENQEALSTAKRLLDENRKMRNMINNGQTEYVGAIKQSVEMKLDKAKQNYKEAYESGDTDRMLEAQEQLTKNAFEMEKVNSYHPTPLQEPNYGVQQQQQPQVDQTALAWQERNKWFGQDEEMTAAALGLHAKLKKEGVQVGSEEYYVTLDKTMRRRFSENFGDSEAPRKKAPNVVAPATRSTGSKKVRLTTSQMNTIKRLNITPEQYVKEVLKLENENV